MFDITVITATHQRPAQLPLCLPRFRQQSIGNLRCEHLVVSDGVDPHARFLCEQFGARYVERAEPGGQWGSLARDQGIQAARGWYLAFWDDDNLYEPHALATLCSAVSGVDLGVVQTRYRFRKSVGAVPGTAAADHGLELADAADDLSTCGAFCSRGDRVAFVKGE